MMRSGLLALAVFVAAAAPAQAQVEHDELSNVYRTLTPYGVWTQMDPYGLVWKPDTRVVGARFYPYLSAGHWLHTPYGWSWASDYSWGWLPFHFGRWTLSGDGSWVWVPGNEWAPAHVAWRTGERFIGWVPLAPEGNGTPLEQPAWVFVPVDRFQTRELQQSRVPADRTWYAYRATGSSRFENADPRRGPDPSLLQRVR
jgi:hypothetical protein